MSELLYKDEVYSIVGAAIEVHKIMGCGFLEEVYQECLEKELGFRKIPFKPQVKLEVEFKGEILKRSKYRADFVCYDKIIVEIKALDRLISKHESQLINYLNATKMKVGVLINFGSYGRLEWKRFVNTL